MFDPKYSRYNGTMFAIFRPRYRQAVYDVVLTLVTHLLPLILFMLDVCIGTLWAGLYLESLQVYLLGACVQGAWSISIISAIVGVLGHMVYHVAVCGGVTPLLYAAPLVLMVAWSLNRLLLQRPLLVLGCMILLVATVQAACMVYEKIPLQSVLHVTSIKIIANLIAGCVLFGLWGSRWAYAQRKVWTPHR